MWKQFRHVRHQLPVMGALGRTIGRALVGSGLTAAGLKRDVEKPIATPGPFLSASMGPVPAGLVSDYVRWGGGDPSRYLGAVPPHLFPHWSVPVLGRTLDALPYPLARILNAGCRIEIHQAIPAGEPMEVSASLDDVDDDGRRVLIRQRTVTRARDGEPLISADVHSIIPLRAKGGRKDRERPRAPEKGELLARHDLTGRAGLQYSCLAGDFNPIHWLRPYAAVFGFKGTLLHGFASAALVFEDLVRMRGCDPHEVRVLEARFTRPLVLPRRVEVWSEDSSLFMADGPGEPAYLTGSYVV